MLTLKKIALLGVASLTAFTMSCSEEDGTEPGGTFNPAFGVAPVANFATLSGTVVANEGNTVTSVTATAGGTAVKFDDTNDFELVSTPAATVSLANVALLGVCGSLTGSQTFAIKVTAKFSDGGDLVGEGNVQLSCGGGTTTDLNEATYTLSNAGTSYADLDTKESLRNADLATKGAGVDVWAFNSGSGAGAAAKIYSSFSDESPATLTGNAFIIPLPAGTKATLAAITTQAQANAYLGTFATTIEAMIDEADGDEVAITADAAFLVSSTGQKLFAAYVTANAASSVTIRAISTP